MVGRQYFIPFSPGLELSVGIIQGSQLAWSERFEKADFENDTSVSGEPVYRIASVSKSITATAVMQLREQDKLSLDDPVTRFLPWFRMKGYNSEDPIRIRNLLSHTAGLPADPPFPVWTTFTHPDEVMLKKGLPDQSVIYPPSMRAKYSNLGYILLGLVIEAVSCKDFQAYIEDSVFDPLGMRNSCVANTEKVVPGYSAPNANGIRCRRRKSDLKGVSAAAGGMSTTLSDLARFVAMHLRRGQLENGTRILSEASVREMQQIQGFLKPWKVGYGLGFYLRPNESGQLVSHGGDLPGYVAQFAMIPDQEVACLALANADDIPVGKIVFRGLQEFTEVSNAESSLSYENNRCQPEWAMYLGEYKDCLDEYEIRIDNDRLVLAEKDGDTLTVLSPIEKHIFCMVSGDYVGELLQFEVDDAGCIQRVKYATDYISPAELT